MNLYAIAETYNNVFQLINDAEEVRHEDFDRLNEIGESFEDKAIAVASFLKNLQAEREAIKSAKESMAAREKRLSSKVEWMTDYLQQNMERCQISEISKSPYFCIKLKKCPPSLFIQDESLVPDKYRKVKKEVSIDKNMIKDDINSGVVVEGCSLQQGTRVEIK